LRPCGTLDRASFDPVRDGIQSLREASPERPVGPGGLPGQTLAFGLGAKLSQENLAVLEYEMDVERHDRPLLPKGMNVASRDGQLTVRLFSFRSMEASFHRPRAGQQKGAPRGPSRSS
jgi:hypothetical protein